MYGIILVCILIIVGVATPYVLKKNDTMVEQIAERALEKELDLPENSIDFSKDDDK